MKQSTAIVKGPLTQRLLAATGALILAGCVAGPEGATAPSVGSLDGARVALPTDGGERELVFLAGRTDAGDLAAFKAAAPNVRYVVPESDDEALRLAPDVHGADSRRCTPEFLAAASQLAWIQVPSAGVDRLLGRQDIRNRKEIVLTNMQGVHGPAIAEHVFGMLLNLTRNVGHYQAPSRRGTWDRGGACLLYTSPSPRD